MRILEAMAADELVNYKPYSSLLLSRRHTSAFIISSAHFFVMDTYAVSYYACETQYDTTKSIIRNCSAYSLPFPFYLAGAERITIEPGCLMAQPLELKCMERKWDAGPF
ncbi:hypothetical protein I7I53_00639 [Histoplasma capsulatum var. duboisii H88]|uniref:Uncharacterized protein n=1 Tax=Ajellomyces capsulatus (strain H88) TaxID=544711 RepID=A0A8A1LIT5_AJEC8|nr:hypothetical protein I7I53_00639 [Histoplasma capsulatum var. duboisii H88]